MVMRWIGGWVGVGALAGSVAATACARSNPAFEADTDTDAAGTQGVAEDGGPAGSLDTGGGGVDGTAGMDDASDDALPGDDGVAETCGDGVRDADEECDDGELNGDTAGCLRTCRKNVCGDGKEAPGQPCDDGNNVSGDGCTDCMLDTCGNGTVEPREACDPEDPVADVECTPFCTLHECGDEFPSPGEACDDGNGDDTDECTNACTIPECGDGIITDTDTYVEECDDANENVEDACIGCVAATCGDGHINAEGNEQCEPELAPMLSCTNSNGDGGTLVCSKMSCTWTSTLDECCIAPGAACLTSDMCCGEAECVDQFCMKG